MNPILTPLFALFTFTSALAARPARAQASERVSVATGGSQANNSSSSLSRDRASVSGDARLVAFESSATNLVPGDTNGVGDIFVRDRATGTTTRVSTSSAGLQANAECQAPEISADGRFVVFTSSANNLASGDANNSPDVFVHDRQSGATTLLSVSLTGSAGAGDSGVGLDIDSYYRRPIADDGRYVAFSSSAGDLVVGDTNFAPDVFVRDRQLGLTTRISVDALGVQASGSSGSPSISADGRYVAFESSANNLTPGDTNGARDIFVKDRVSAAIVLASANAGGVAANFMSSNASLSADGRSVAFLSAANNLVPGDTNSWPDVFVKRLDTNAIVRASVQPGGLQSFFPSEGPMLSRDGRFVAFRSQDPTLVASDSNGVAADIFVRDLTLGATSLASVGASGAQSQSSSSFADLSSNGLVVAFSSAAADLVAGDTNTAVDVFVRNRPSAGPTAFCSAKSNSAGCLPKIDSVGSPTVGPGSFVIRASDVLNNKNGLLFYGYGAWSAPFQGGFMCVQLPTRRTPVSNSLGNPPPDDCSGLFQFDMHAWIAAGSDPQLVVGASIAAQFWSRDPLSTPPVGLTDALAFTIQP